MRHFILTLTLIALSACSSTVQTSSGREFQASRGQITDAAIAAAAQGEPDLHFPANIGIARIIGGKISTSPQAELSLLHVGETSPLGQFIPVNPMITQTLQNAYSQTNARKIQLTAARQHLDYVFIYELDREGSGFGAIGRVNAMVMDVRSGYVYATASKTVNVAGFGTIRRGWGDRILNDEAAAKVVKSIAPDIEVIFTTLYQRAQ